MEKQIFRFSFMIEGTTQNICIFNGAMTLRITRLGIVEEPCYSECHLGRLSLMLSVINKLLMLSVIMLNVIMLNVVMLPFKTLVSSNWIRDTQNLSFVTWLIIQIILHAIIMKSLSSLPFTSIFVRIWILFTLSKLPRLLLKQSDCSIKRFYNKGQIHQWNLKLFQLCNLRYFLSSCPC